MGKKSPPRKKLKPPIGWQSRLLEIVIYGLAKPAISALLEFFLPFIG